MFKDVKGYEGIYQVDEYCNVFSLISNKVLKPAVSQHNGYKHVMLIAGDGSRHTHYIHRLVAENWIPNPDNKPVVLHGDNNKLNTHVSNLSWGSYSDNSLQAYNDGILYPIRDEGDRIRFTGKVQILPCDIFLLIHFNPLTSLRYFHLRACSPFAVRFRRPFDKRLYSVLAS